jgi:PAS domain S-box-containing protein
MLSVIFCLHFEVVSPWFVYDPPLLVPVLNVLFLSLVSFYISGISGRAYLTGGQPSLLCMGCGALAAGVASVAAGWFMGSHEAQDLSASIYNAGFFLGGLFHLAGAGFTLLETGEERRPEWRRRKIVLAYAGVAAMILLLLSLNMDRSLPLFFNPLAGPTPFRQLVLGWAIVLFALSSVFFLAASHRLHVAFLYWYGLGLLLISSGLLALFLVFVVGSPMAWAGRISLYAGGIYLVIAVSKAMISARSRRVSLDRIVTGLLPQPRALYESRFIEMRRSMEALARERGFLNAVLEQMPAGVIIAEAGSGKPILGNRKAEMFWMEGFREESVDEWPLRQSIQNGEVVLQKEIGFSRRNGTRAIMSANSAPIYDEENRIVAGVITFHDITPRKEMEDELRQSRRELERRVRERTAELERKNQDLQDFAFIASHDLHEPLRKIQTFGDLLVGKFKSYPDELARDYVSRMQKAAARMEVLLDSLLKYSRLNSREQTLSQIDLGDAVRDAMSNLEIRIKETGGTVEVGPLPTLEADVSQISQVFQSLIANALKFHQPSEKPRVRIYSRPHGDGLPVRHEICVEDNGIGFDEKYLDRIFMPFQRLHGRNEYNGVGMGLAICRKIVERHGGEITARSSEGKGSLFIFTLPEVQTVHAWACQ